MKDGRTSDAGSTKLRGKRRLGGRVTIRTVAEDAGVSVSAVSKVLRNAYGVSDSLRTRVDASISKLGYRPSASARGMRGQSFTLGVLLTDLRNPFFSEIIEGINTTLATTPYQPLIGVSQLQTQIERSLIDAMLDRQMDGLIFVSPRLPSADIEEVARTVPSVVIGLHTAQADLFDTVNDDDAAGGEMVVDHLVQQGRTDIAYLTLAEPGKENTVMHHREIGYRRAMQRHGLSDKVRVFRGTHQDDLSELIDQTIAATPRPDAIFCWGDPWALRAISMIAKRGLRIPEDVALVGYDNSYFTGMAQNELTSVDQSGLDLGKEAARLLIERIEGRTESRHVIIPPQLVVRRSSGRSLTSQLGMHDDLTWSST